MGGASSYLAILAIVGFLIATWLASKLSKLIGVSAIILEITTGVILGPRVLGLISSEYATCEYITHTECELPPNFEQRVVLDQPVGKDLGRIINMGLCNLEDYDMSHVVVGDAIESERGFNENSFFMAPGEEDPGAGDAAAVNTAGGVAPDTTVVGAAAVSTNVSAGSVRRLAGGGGDFATFSECVQRSCEADVSHRCGLTPDIFTLIGHTGVALMIFESGMEFNFDMAKIVGPKACAVAVLGTILPLISGSILMVIYGYPLLPDAISVGTSLAPTSVGIALRLLGEADMLQEKFGQTIMTAAFVDDILSLVLFNILFSLRGEFNVMATVVYPVVGVIWMGIAMVMAVKFWPAFVDDFLLPKLRSRKSTSPKVTQDDETVFFIMMTVLVGYGTITHYLGTHLWGCFIAGMSFARVGQGHHTVHLWQRQTRKLTSWMIRIFFACTVAFSIPINKLLSIEALWKGSLMGLGPCVATKVLCAPFLGNEKFVVGWAMVGRAEFAYLIAQMAAAAGMIDEATFSICIWALLYATVLAPLVFRRQLARYVLSEGLAAKSANDDDDHAKVEAGDYSKGGAAESAEEKWAKKFRDLDDIEIECCTDAEKMEYQRERGANIKDGDQVVGQPGATPAARGRNNRGVGAVSKDKQYDKGLLCCLFFRRMTVS